MFETYKDELGRIHNVSSDMLDAFMEKYPNAITVDEPGKTTDSSIEAPATESNVMGSKSVSGSLGSQNRNWKDTAAKLKEGR